MPGLQQLWSLTPGNNQTADPEVNMRENMAPSQVNDAIRQIMRKVKALVLDTSGTLGTGGTGTAYTLTTNEGFSALIDGLVVAFTAHTDCGAAPTLNVDGLGAKAFVKQVLVGLDAGDIRGGRMYRARYNAADSQWHLQAAAAGNDQLVAPTGTRMLFQQTAAPLGWTKETNAAYDDSALRIVTGAVGNGGSAGFSSTFAARTIAQANLPNVSFIGSAAAVGDHSHGGATDLAGSHSHGGLTNGAGSHSHTPSGGGSFRTNRVGEGAAGGADRSILADATTNTVGDHQHGIPTEPSHGHTFTTGLAGGHGHSVSVASGGLGTALDFAVKYRDIIVAQKA